VLVRRCCVLIAALRPVSLSGRYRVGTQRRAAKTLAVAHLQAGAIKRRGKLERQFCNIVAGVLSPLLANVLLDEVDRELERRGHRFVRCADDCNVHVGSPKAGQRVLQALRGCCARLALKVNEAKTAVAEVWGRKFLGYCFWAHQGEAKRAVATVAPDKLRERIRQPTRRTRGRSLEQIAADSRDCVPGGKSYFRLAQTPKVMRELDEWLRHRLRAVQLKQWRRGTTMFRELRKLGASVDLAARIAGNARRWWRNSRRGLNLLLPIAYFDRLGVPRFS
jgi:RNA-directed DNA polymerase